MKVRHYSISIKEKNNVSFKSKAFRPESSKFEFLQYSLLCQTTHYAGLTEGREESGLRGRQRHRAANALPTGQITDPPPRNSPTRVMTKMGRSAWEPSK